MKKKKPKKQTDFPVMTREEEMNYVKTILGYKTLLKPTKWWLDTGYPRLNAVMGSKEHGLGSGKIYLIAGKESSGKSLIAAFLAGLAQQKAKADPAWVDGENSFDRHHVRRQGLDAGKTIRGPNGSVIGYSKLAYFYPEFGEFKLSGSKKSKVKQKKKQSTGLGDVEPAEYVFERVETWMKLRRKSNPEGRLVVVVDSTNAFAPKEEQDAGFTDQNMKTRMASAVFLNTLTKRLAPLAVHTNAIIILISQLRTNPAKLFGNPDYIPGGGGLKYHPSCIVWMRRVKDGEIKQGTKNIGVKGLITNVKNKVGGGSVEHKKAGYMTYFFKNKWKFTSLESIKGEI